MEPVVGANRVIRVVVALLLSLSSTLVSLSFPAEAHNGTVLSTIGTATIDGILSPGEWNNAACANFDLVTLGDVHPSTLCAMNDETYLFLAVIIRNEDFKASSFGIQGDILTLFFDNNHNGGIAFTNSEHGDDFVQLQQGFLGYFLDAFHCLPPVCAFPTFAQDVDFGGTTDVAATISHTNPVPGELGDYVYEIRKKLNSGDTQHDFALVPGSTVGVFVYFVDTLVGTNSGSPASWPGPDDCTLFGSSTPCVGADIVIAHPVIPVAIDIKPGSFPNSINLSSAGTVPVAILSSPTFSAPTEANPSTVTLAGAKVKLIGKGNKYACTAQDVNGDGLLDLVCHVVTAQFLIAPGDSVAALEAETFSGTPIRGEDSIRLVPD